MRRNDNHNNNHRLNEAEFRGRIATEIEHVKRKLEILEQNVAKIQWWLLGLLGGMVVSLAILIAEFTLKH